MGTPFSSIDLALLKKYDKPGPRYTSYPTAPIFSPSFTPQAYRESLVATNQSGSSNDLSLYFHFPFCDTLCYFCGCTMLVTRDRDRIEEYNQYLKREMDLLAPLVSKGRRVVQLHWGGGTPTHLSPKQIHDIASHISSRFDFADDAERSVELDPREMTQEHVAALAEAGFTRMSMGVQDFDERVQESVNRIQPESMTRQVLDWARELGFTSVNIDLIYGLPHQTVDSFHQTIDTVLTFAPDRIAVFNYAHVPWLKSHQKLILPEHLPTPEQKLDILKMTIESLSMAGYEYIGMDHFAKPTDELARAQREKTLYRNFQGYSTRSGADLYGIGMSSIGHFGRVYAQNLKTLPEYYKALREGDFATHVGYTMTDDDVLRKYVIMRLMCDLELEFDAVEKEFGIHFAHYFSQALQQLKPFEEDGLVTVSDRAIHIIGAGRLLLRNIAMPFDSYLETMSKSKPIFSRTV